MRNILKLIAVAVLFTACENIVTDDINLDAPIVRLVVEGGITKVKGQELSIQQVFVSQSLDIFKADDRKPITDAVVVIRDENNNSYNMTQNSDSLGLYESIPLATTLGETYMLSIIWNGEEYRAEEMVSPVPVIDSIYTVFEEDAPFSDDGYRVNIDFTDTPGEINFYFWQVFVEGENRIVPDPGNEDNLIQSDEFFDGSKVTGYQPNEDALPLIGEEVEVRQLGISKQYFDFLRTLLGQTSTVDGIFDTPPVPIRGNIVNITNPDNFGLGYFSASEVSVAKIVIEE